ncbi:MAG TPA: S46 family peptidase, partial [Flavipsychrobacter sp.]|nr:S46 family peptidase [Flavipsychrobacter sp.]
MKKLLLSVCAVAMMLSAYADEGMWLPMLIGKNYDQMKREGLKLSEEDLYSINHSSLKDAIVQFAGGCTAEIISDNGLVLTNHH